MNERLVVQEIHINGRCGITREERQHLQPILVDVEIDYPHDRAITTGDINQTIDYAKVADRVLAVGSSKEYCLIETLAEDLIIDLFAHFPVSDVHLWVRKTAPPLPSVKGSVGIRLNRIRGSGASTSSTLSSPPASFLLEQLHRLPQGHALDIATGYGRNALFLASMGYTVEGVDRDEQALTTVHTLAQERSLENVTTRNIDLEANPHSLLVLPKEQYDVILVFFYLFRPLFPSLVRALKPGGTLIYETFLIDNHLRYQHPRRREFCLDHNELLQLSSGLRTLFYEEGEHDSCDRGEKAFTARLLAEKEVSDGSR